MDECLGVQGSTKARVLSSGTWRGTKDERLATACDFDPRKRNEESEE